MEAVVQWLMEWTPELVLTGSTIYIYNCM